jgi:hypothetical protein
MEVKLERKVSSKYCWRIDRYREQDVQRLLFTEMPYATASRQLGGGLHPVVDVDVRQVEFAPTLNVHVNT